MDKIEIADRLDKAADEMLVRGQANGKFMQSDGSVCALGAIALVSGKNVLPYQDEWDRPMNEEQSEAYYSWNEACDDIWSWAKTDPAASTLGKYINQEFGTVSYILVSAVYQANDSGVWDPTEGKNVPIDMADVMRGCAKTLREEAQGG